jgi:hypothetical protein
VVLSNPIWLWALAGLSIPIGIHLLSRKEGKVIRIGSLRHLQETNTQQFKGIRLNEIVLLALRCTLILLFVLMMCGLSFEKERTTETKWLLIEKGLEKLIEAQSRLDTFELKGYEVRWLADRFPLFEDSASVSGDPLYWKLVEQLQHEQADDVIVISRSNIKNFKGKRPELNPTIRWVTIPEEPRDFIVKASNQGDSILVRKGYAQSDKTYFTTRVFSSKEWDSRTPLNPRDSVRIVIYADDIHRYDRRIVEASLQAMKLTYPISPKIVNISPAQVTSFGSWDWCIWLAAQPVSDTIDSNVIYLEPGTRSEILVQERSNRWAITKRLNEEVALGESFTVKLAALLLCSENDWAVANQNDKRMISDQSAWSNNDSERTEHASMIVQSADSYLLILFLLTLLIERTLAYYRNQ